MITFSSNDCRQESYIYGGWHLAIDDDSPRPPECDEPLASGQRKRWLRERRTMGPSGAF